MTKVCAIILAGGSSARMGGVDKVFVPLGGQTVLARSIAAFDEHPDITGIIVVSRADALEDVKRIAAPFSKVCGVTVGGSNRFQSVQNGISAAGEDAEYFAIHDAARPFVSARIISDVVAAAKEWGAAAPARRVVDTVKVIDENGCAIRTPDRNTLLSVTTPQVVERNIYLAAAKGQTEAFDDSELLERAGHPVRLVVCEDDNMKITTREDLMKAKARAGEATMRIGHGYDVHRLVAGRKLTLGGVVVPNECGLLGHSDADVLVHAVMDALLGAAALDDIGALFPDNDPQYAGADSLVLLGRVMEEVRKAGYQPCNIDATILCQAPKLRPFIPTMRENIARVTGMQVQDVSVKATTEEGLGFTGAKDGIAAHAVVLLDKAL